MIPIVIQNGVPMIWTAADWLKVREDSRIVGNLIGCLPGLSRQEILQGLPMTLLEEEVTLLLENNEAYVTGDAALTEPPDQKLKENFLLYKENNRKEQLQCYEKERQMQITSMIDKIIEGKRNKLLGMNTKKRKLNNGESAEGTLDSSLELELDREEILKSELNKSSETFSPPLLIQTFTKEPWNTETSDVQWNFPETPKEKLKYAVFKDLWEKTYFITNGHKFGVDYLVYPGDPVKFHAQFLIVCADYNENLSTKDLISYARLGSITRKTFAIASQLPDSGEIVYQSIQWADKM